MLFPTVQFGIFFVIVFALNWALVERPLWRHSFLVAASYFFYACWDWRFMFLLFGCSTANYLFGRWIGATENERRRKTLLVLSLIWNLGLLGYFKYCNFFLSSLDSLLRAIGWPVSVPVLEVVLPVGVSFFTFEAISYVVDVYRRKIPACRNYLHILLFISCFPRLIAGPIMRAGDFLPQLLEKPDVAKIDVSRAFLLSLGGLFKKCVIANYIGTQLVDTVFEDPSACGAADALVGIYGWAVQIFCDFSAYSDIAIGVAALLGFRFPDNFNQPFRAASLRDYWRRWHISLSSWLRDYVYFPLGGSKKGNFNTYRNLFITFVLGGLWHGAAWTFVAWGFIHASGLCIERAIRRAVGERRYPWWAQALGVVATFHFVCAARIFFRSSSFEVALEFFRALVNVHAQSHLVTPFVFALIVIGMGMHFVPRTWGEFLRSRLAAMPVPAQGVAFGLGLVLLSAMSPPGVAPFVYFRF